MPLWLYPGERWTPSASAEDGEEAAAGAQVARSGQRAERVEERDSERNLLLFRLESLLSWSEHLALDRCSDDEDDRTARASPKTSTTCRCRASARRRAAACAWISTCRPPTTMTCRSAPG